MLTSWLRSSCRSSTDLWICVMFPSASNTPQSSWSPRNPPSQGSQQGTALHQPKTKLLRDICTDPICGLQLAVQHYHPVHPSTCQWIYTFLTNRRQQVMLVSILSYIRTISTSAPPRGVFFPHCSSFSTPTTTPWLTRL